MIKTIQLNAGRSKIAHDLLEAKALQDRASLLLVSEPNQAFTKTWLRDAPDGDVAIKIMPTAATAAAGSGSPGRGILWVKLGKIAIYTCYFSPNATLQQYKDWLQLLQASITSHRGLVLVTGDFNARSPQWGGTVTNPRGLLMADLIAACNLHLINTGDTPTFARGSSVSYLDLTLATPKVAPKIRDWRVEDDKASASLHHYITFSLAATRHLPSTLATPPTTSWAVGNINHLRLREKMTQTKLPDDAGAERMAEAYTAKLQTACEAAVPKKGRNQRTRPYWWTPEVAAARKKANAAHRRVTRARPRNNPDALPPLLDGAKEANKALRIAIYRAKEKSWKDLCDKVEQDPWGLPYKIVAQKLAPRTPGPDITVPGGIDAVMAALFPDAPPTEPPQPPDLQEPDHDPFTEEEVATALRNLPNGKASGPDNVPNEVLKAAAAGEEGIRELTRVLNTCMTEGTFPATWKKARVVLIPKKDKAPDNPSAFRPLSMLDSTGKIYERLLADRLNQVLHDLGGLSPRQYGFRRGRSTVDAIREAMRLAAEANSGPLRKRRHCVMVSLDVKNAFNTLPWHAVHAALQTWGVPWYLRRVIGSYLLERKLQYTRRGEPADMDMRRGVPQGSVLGPLLWNIVYDAVLRLQLPEGVDLIAFADDLAIICRHTSLPRLKTILEDAMATIVEWLESVGLQLAPHKTAAVRLSTKRSQWEPDTAITALGHQIPVGKTLKYLGVTLESNPNCSTHVAAASTAAAKTGAAIARLLTNHRGPGEAKRKLLATVARSKLLYAAPAWPGGTKADRNRMRLRTSLRPGAISITRAYRTTSTDALEVLAAEVPADLAAEERCRVYEAIKEGQSKVEAKREAREATLEQWQTRWTNLTTKAQWTRTLIPTIRPWILRKHGTTTHHLTQILTGHGSFRSYLVRIGKMTDPHCTHCTLGEEDDALHTLAHCPAWEPQRTALSQTLGATIAPDTFVEAILQTPERWEAAEKFAKDVLSSKDI